jgi:hypothetical protein
MAAFLICVEVLVGGHQFFGIILSYRRFSGVACVTLPQKVNTKPHNLTVNSYLPSTSTKIVTAKTS